MITITKRALLALFLGALFITGARAQGTYTAATCNLTDVNDCVNGSGANTCKAQGSSTGATHTAVNGDTINIPSTGSPCTWTSGISVPSGIGISIIGAGASSTTIIDDDTSGTNLFYFNPTYGSALSRISSMTFSPASGLSANSLSAPIAFQGTCATSGCPNVRVDNLVIPGTPSWDGLTMPSSTLVVVDNVFGVLDHNTLTETNANGYYEFVNFNNSSWNGVGQYGDNSWASGDTFGTNQAVYVETNTFTETGTGLFPITESEGGFGGTSEGGGRVVCRFNTAVGLRSMCVNHGTESNGRPRGGRQMEFYANSLSCPSSSYPGCFNNDMLQGAGTRSGSLIAIGNNYTWGSGTGINQFASISEYRAFQNIGTFGPCDGTGQWDDNDPTTYWTGTISSVSGSNPYTITVSGSPGWTANQWVSNGSPYSVHDSTINNGSEITAGGSNTLTVTAWTSIPYAAGDSIQIRRAYACIDQSSRIEGSLLSASTPSPTNSSGSYVYQISDPAYEAADTSSGSPVFGFLTSDTARIIANRDFYAEVSQSAQTSSSSPFNGTAGTGYGTLDNRPTTCTTGVGYWATDQGSWNTSGATFPNQTWSQGELFVCTATNSWSSTPYYTPYTYPHPLTDAADPPPLAPPSNVQAVGH